MRKLASGLIVAGAALAACGDDGGGATATATFMGVSGQAVAGTARFTRADDGKVRLVVTMTAAPPGTHGIHIHAVPACGNQGMDAGPHWDPEDTAAGKHRLPPEHGHLGDLGNITIADDGTGTLAFSNPAWTLGDGAPSDVVSHAIILHQLRDDGTMPSSGARWGCALIVAD